MNTTERYLTLGKKSRGLHGRAVYFTKPVKRIVIHWIGPYPYQSIFSPWYWWEDGPDKTGVQASAHFIVKENDVLQALPINEVGWHSGDPRNYESVGIEVIPMNEKGEFADNTINTLKELVAYIRTIYPGAKLERHFDGVQKKNCPNFYTPYETNGDEKWIELRNFLDGVGAE